MGLLVHQDQLAQEVIQEHPDLPVIRDHLDLKVSEDLLDQLVNQDQPDKSDHQEMQDHKVPTECKEHLEYKDFQEMSVLSVTLVHLDFREHKAPLESLEPQASQDH